MESDHTRVTHIVDGVVGGRGSAGRRPVRSGPEADPPSGKDELPADLRERQGRHEGDTRETRGRPEGRRARALGYHLLFSAEGSGREGAP